MIKVQRHFTKGNQIIIDLCRNSKELYNKCNYILRQAYFSNQTLPNQKQLYNLTKNENCFKNLHNTKIATQTIRKLLFDWMTYFKTLKAWNNTFKKPKPPYYKKNLTQVIFDNQTITNGRSKLLSPIILEPKSKCFSIFCTKKYKQIVITPKTFGFMIDVQYEVTIPEKTNNKSICNIDIGINNLATLTSDQHLPILINGRIVKSINQYYNKYPTKQNSKKRYFRLENYFHHASKMIISNCLKHNIGTIIIGKNIGWKQETNLGKSNNQKFQYIPFCKLIQKIQYKAELAGINVIFTEEAYTSLSSYLDKDPLPKYEKGVKHKFSGKRCKGLYKRSNGETINADVNGSANIGRKVIKDKDIILKLDRSVAATPVRINPLKSFMYIDKGFD